ncbi:MAG: DUF3857 domain-containing protein, partial [Acidobacteriota bacterium]
MRRLHSIARGLCSAARAFAAPGLAALCLGAAPGLAQLPEHPALGQTPTPDWVEEQPLRDPEPVDGGEIAYLLVDRQTRLPESGPEQTYHRFAYRIESRTALDDWSSWQIPVEPNYEKLLLHGLRVKRGDAWQDRLERSRATLLQREAELEQLIFDGRQTLLIVFDDIRVGDIVDISYSLAGANPLFQNRYDDASWLSWSMPVARAHLRLIHPGSRSVQVAALAGAPEPEQSVESGWVTRRWQLDDLTPDSSWEPGTPSSVLTRPLVDLSEYDSWSDIAAWGVPLYRTGSGAP